MCEQKGPAPEKGPPDWVVLDPGEARPPPSDTFLQQQVEVYRDDYYRERVRREKAEEKTRELEAEIKKLKDQLSQQEAQEMNCEATARAEEERQAMIRKQQESQTELRLLRQQVSLLEQQLLPLQQNWRQQEAERSEAVMQAALAKAGLGPAPWTCPMCTYDNPADAKVCEMCAEPAPKKSLPMDVYRSMVVCD